MDVLLDPNGLAQPTASLVLAGAVPTVSKSMMSVAELAAPCDHPDISLRYRRHLGLLGGQEDVLTRASLEVTNGVLRHSPSEAG